MENKVVNKQIPIKSIIDVANYFDDYKSRYDNIFEQEKIKNKNVEFSEKKYEYENGNTELRYTVKLRNGQNMTETDYNWFIGQLGNPRAIEEVFIDLRVSFYNKSGKENYNDQYNSINVTVDFRDARMDLVFVSQEVELFDLSIRDNLCLGKEIAEEKIMQLLDEAGLMNWYKELPNGLETMVGEKGIKLSAGQKQRLNLIRGILIDKELYFFDEPTSNLDIVSEEKMISMIKKYLNNKTYVIITHRPKITELCNRHYIFEEHMMKEVVKVQ